MTKYQVKRETTQNVYQGFKINYNLKGVIKTPISLLLAQKQPSNKKNVIVCGGTRFNMPKIQKN